MGIIRVSIEDRVGFSAASPMAPIWLELLERSLFVLGGVSADQTRYNRGIFKRAPTVAAVPVEPPLPINASRIIPCVRFDWGNDTNASSAEMSPDISA